MWVPLLSSESGPGVPLLNFEGGPGSQVSRSQGPCPTFTPCRMNQPLAETKSLKNCYYSSLLFRIISACIMFTWFVILQKTK